MTNFQCQLQHDLLPQAGASASRGQARSHCGRLTANPTVEPWRTGPEVGLGGSEPNRDCREARFWIAFGFPTIQGDIANFIKTFSGASGPIPSATRSIRWALTG